MRKNWLIVAFVLALSACLPVLALAQVGANGEGTVIAEGNGRAWLRGEGDISISGNGLLIIWDYAGDAVIEVTGEGRRIEREHITTYRGFDGTASISGSDIAVLLRGTDIQLEATGAGTVRLQGVGTYEFNGASGRWTARGVTLTLE